MERKAFSTEQESFWAGAFGTEYIHRNKSAALLAANLNFFSNALKHAGNIESCIEFGANIGMNLQALALLFPGMRQQAIEINADAARELAARLGEANVFNGSIFEWTPTVAVDLALVKGVLIHINPGRLADVYRALHDATRRWILVCEYYNPSPVAIEYRGHHDRLFKRDFAGEILDAYPDVRLVDYGFAYRRDPAFPQDDITWFLLEKHN